jgi:hypothetical protein
MENQNKLNGLYKRIRLLKKENEELKKQIESQPQETPSITKHTDGSFTIRYKINTPFLGQLYTPLIIYKDDHL